MTKITTDFVGTESTAVTKQRLTDILEFWGYDPDAYTTWGNARANLNSLLSGTALGAIGATELASTFLPKINFLNDSDEVVADALFSASEPGVWYDPNDTSTLFQDTAGAVPVTTPGQTVGRVNDKSGNGNHATQATAAARPTYGIVPETGRRNLLTHTEAFDNAGWVKGGGVSVTQILGQEWEFNEGTSGSGAKVINQDFSSLSETGTAIDVKPGNASPFMRLTTRNNFTTNFLDFNLLTGETFTDGGGFSSVEFNVVALEDGYFRLSINAGTVTDTARSRHLALVFLDADRQLTFTGTGRTVRIRRPQRELGQATPYQRVGTQFDVTEAGVPSLGYLSFDGVDDFLQTPTITPGTDKVQVFTGVRILTPRSNNSPIVQIGDATTSATDALIRLVTGDGTTDSYRASLIGSAVNQTQRVARVAPYSAQFTCIFDATQTGPDEISLRENGTVTGVGSATDSGLTTIGAQQIFYGTNSAFSTFLNGHIHQLITRFGPNLSTADIQKAERYVASKTAGVTL